MASDQRWLWREVVFTVARNREVHEYIVRHLQEIIVLDKQPIAIYDSNLDNVIRGRREHMVIFYHTEDVEGWLNYINGIMYGNITAIRVK